MIRTTKFFEKAQIPPAEIGDDYAAGIKAGLKEQSLATVKALGAPPAGTVEFYKDITLRDGFTSSLKIFRPENGGGPLVVLAFGGGFLGGDNDQLSGEARALVKLFGATVVNISYRVGPEDKFPTPQHDAWDSLIWIADNAADEALKSDPAKGILLGGVSAGAALTGVLSRKFTDEPLKYPLTGQWLCVPPLMQPENVPAKFKEHHISREQNADNPVLPTEGIKKMIALSAIDTESELAFAVNSSTDIAKQPRTYFQIDGMDPLRDDGLVYEEMLREAGVQTKVDFYPGCPHAHQMMMPMLEVGRRANVDALVGFGWLLGREVGREEAARALGVEE